MLLDLRLLAVLARMIQIAPPTTIDAIIATTIEIDTVLLFEPPSSELKGETGVGEECPIGVEITEGCPSAADFGEGCVTISVCEDIVVVVMVDKDCVAAIDVNDGCATRVDVGTAVASWMGV